MVHTEMSIGLKMLSVAQASMLFFLTMVSIGWGMEQDNETKSKCAFTKYLQNPDNRERYENTLARARGTYAQKNNYDNAAMYGVIAKASFGIDNGENLDSFSAGCLSCHDGKSASNVRPNFRNSPNKKSIMMMISGKHPIGMDYEKYAMSNHHLKSLDEMGQNLTLVEGRVSCITCHDPLSPENNHLVATQSGVDLCSACHTL